MRRPELILLHSASAGGCNAGPNPGTNSLIGGKPELLRLAIDEEASRLGAKGHWSRWRPINRIIPKAIHRRYRWQSRPGGRYSDGKSSWPRRFSCIPHRDNVLSLLDSARLPAPGVGRPPPNLLKFDRFKLGCAWRHPAFRENLPAFPNLQGETGSHQTASSASQSLFLRDLWFL